MKFTVTVDMDAFDEDFEEDLKSYIKDEVFKVVKKDPKYKEYIEVRAKAVLDSIKI